jgi:nucleotide-binding universal stress UspA family protein
VGLITNILFPVDFSHSCIAMGAYVKRVAAIFGARVSIIHVFDSDSHNGLELYVRAPDEIAQEHEALARARLDSFLQSEFPVSRYPRILVSGDVASQIALNARNGFDLIVMPTHAGTFRRMLIGSTTAKVLNDVDCPVVTSEHTEKVAPRPIAHRELLCAIGLGENSERVLRYAHQLSGEVRANLRIVHAVQAVGSFMSSQFPAENRAQSEERQQAYERTDALQRRVGSQAPIRIVVGPVKEALLEAARQSDADVLIVGRGSQLSFRGRLRDLTYAMVRDSPYPVLCV